jgi:zinc D-Ala-D-Ala carboxypeptidase
MLITLDEQWDTSRWPSFDAKEFRSHGNNELKMESSFLDILQSIRDALKEPMIISSGYRDPDHNMQVSSTGLSGPHVKGLAADIKCYGASAHRLVQIAMSMGITGLGVKQNGDWGSRFIHLDTIRDDGRPRVWSY